MFFMFQTIPFGLIFGEVNVPAFLGSNSVQISILGVKYPTTTDRTLPTTRHPDPDLLVVCALGALGAGRLWFYEKFWGVF